MYYDLLYRAQVEIFQIRSKLSMRISFLDLQISPVSLPFPSILPTPPLSFSTPSLPFLAYVFPSLTHPLTYFSSPTLQTLVSSPNLQFPISSPLLPSLNSPSIPLLPSSTSLACPYPNSFSLLSSSPFPFPTLLPVWYFIYTTSSTSLPYPTSPLAPCLPYFLFLPSLTLSPLPSVPILLPLPIRSYLIIPFPHSTSPTSRSSLTSTPLPLVSSAFPYPTSSSAHPLHYSTSFPPLLPF